MKKFIAFIIGVLLIAIIFKCNNTPANVENSVSADSTAVTKAANESTNDHENLNWEYSQKSDPMTDKVIYFATASSVNLLNFDFPYDGGSTLYVEIRKKEGVNEVLLHISKGQFISAYDNMVSIKYDDKSLIKYGFNEAADGSSNYIFLHSSKSIIEKLKKTKHIKIQAPFYQAGNQVAEFDINGLKWDH